MRGSSTSGIAPSGIAPSGILPFAVIIPAAGVGSRSGKDVPKQYIPLNGEPMLRHTLRPFAAMSECIEIVIPTDATWRMEAEACAVGFDKIRFVEGGTERQHSIANGIEAISSDAEVILVHDAARPCISPDLIERVVRAAAADGAAIPVMPIAETVKVVMEGGWVLRTVPRETLNTAQTPQGFRADLLRTAYARAAERGFIGTDDSSLVEDLGEPVRAVPGDPENLKVTWPADFERAEAWLRRSHPE